MRRIIIIAMAMGLAAISGCGGGQNFALDIVLPDEAARNQVDWIRVVSVIPGEGATCSALLDQSATPGDAEYAIEAEIGFDYPVTDSIGRLENLGPGLRLLFAEGEDDVEGIILVGCTQVEAGGGGPTVVSIELSWVTGCEQTNGGVEICDGIDNDCDESTDEGDLGDLCPAPEHAEALACQSGTCEFQCLSVWLNVDDNWANGCECRPTRGGDEWCDGLDNDCDGTVDNAGCLQCANDADCASPVDCIGGLCTGGTCSVDYLPDASVCDDGDACTLDDRCTGGDCAGTVLDCDDGLFCTDDACDAGGNCTHDRQDGYCLIDDTCTLHGETSEDSTCRTCDAVGSPDAWVLEPDGTSCEDGLACTGTDTCDATGECVHTNLPCPDPCMGACEEGTLLCSPDAPDTLCDDGLACTENEICDGLGNCSGTAILGYCGGDEECRPDCAQDALGCVDKPSFIQLNCPADPPADQPAICGVVINGSPGSEACVNCQVKLIPGNVSADDFRFSGGSCDLGGWAFEPDSCSSSSFWCPYSTGGPTEACCTDAACTSDGLVFSENQCPADAWRLSQVFDFSPFELVRVCYEVVQRPDAFGASVQIDVGDGDPATATEVTCDPPGSWNENYPTKPCVNLPGSVGDRPSSTVTFWSEAVGGEGFTNLSKVDVYAYPPECNQRQTVVDTTFLGCPNGATEFEGWDFLGGAACADQQAQCGSQGGLLLGTIDGMTVTNLDADYALDLRGVRTPAQLCWSEYSSAGVNASYEVVIQGSGGGVWIFQLYESQFPPFALNPMCREICVDLTPIGPMAFGLQNSWISFQGSATSGHILINDVRLEASLECPPDGVLDVGQIEPDGAGGFQVQVNNLVGLPRNALLECTWGDGAVASSREFFFAAP